MSILNMSSEDKASDNETGLLPLGAFTFKGNPHPNGNTEAFYFSQVLLSLELVFLLIKPKVYKCTIKKLIEVVMEDPPSEQPFK